ncbi:hypothetical protein [uncultured Paraglaciecola sp.]|uniref:hypothetical protein n=1 Tax=uncultured Paraglaciecola sp. TaxID=1765024 RepID=UPI002592A694|nr:hypothetical protein [uncultured Paraglaciecola sp.]
MTNIVEKRHGIVTALIFLFVLIVYFIANNTEGQSVLLLVIPMGMLGATVRDYASFQQKNNKASQSIYEQLYLILIGAIMAVVATIMFSTSAIEGAIFPEVIGGDKPFENIKSSLRGDVTLKSNSDFYKLILWCFIAGLSDNFVYQKLSAWLTK